jgi:hypothetical protein
MGERRYAGRMASMLPVSSLAVMSVATGMASALATATGLADVVMATDGKQ